jgi:hypothetical protein
MTPFQGARANSAGQLTTLDLKLFLLNPSVAGNLLFPSAASWI